MGLLVEGEWHDKWYDTESSGGKFVHPEAAFRYLSEYSSAVWKARKNLQIAQSMPLNLLG